MHLRGLKQMRLPKIIHQIINLNSYHVKFVKNGSQLQKKK